MAPLYRPGFFGDRFNSLDECVKACGTSGRVIRIVLCEEMARKERENSALTRQRTSMDLTVNQSSSDAYESNALIHFFTGDLLACLHKNCQLTLEFRDVTRTDGISLIKFWRRPPVCKIRQAFFSPFLIG
jgi:hypothetical protein